MTITVDTISVRIWPSLTQDVVCLTNTLPLTGSFHDASKDLVQEIEQLEKMFTVETPKLKEITDHFVKELTKGMLSMSRRQHRLICVPQV
jgi:hypothetical protein